MERKCLACLGAVLPSAYRIHLFHMLVDMSVLLYSGADNVIISGSLQDGANKVSMIDESYVWASSEFHLNGSIE